jgi:hypothetical protein
MNLDLALLLAAIIFTILLAAVGVEMANNPPTSKKAKWAYRTAFIVLGLLLIGTTYWQGQRNIDEQNRIKLVAEAQEKKLDDRYDEIKTQYSRLEGRLTSIQNFSKHPPANFTPQQVGEAIRTMAGSGNLKQRAFRLANEIAEFRIRRWQLGIDLSHQNDQQQMQRAAIQSISDHFRDNDLQRVKDMRDEFIPLHIRNQDLDEFLRIGEMEKQAQDLRARNNMPGRQTLIMPDQIERIENELRGMAKQLKD